MPKATGDQWRNNSRKNEGMEPKQKQYPVVDVAGNRSKVQCCKQQYCMGTWNVMSMNQGKLEAVKQEMTRVNIDILGISELRWTGMETNPITIKSKTSSQVAEQFSWVPFPYCLLPCHPLSIKAIALLPYVSPWTIYF